MAANGLDGKKNGDGKLVAALAMGMTRSAAAKYSGIAPRTISRRLKDSAFNGRVCTARDRILSRACGRAAAKLTRAVDTLGELLKSESEVIRLRAAVAVIEAANRFRELNDHAQKLEAIEAKLKSLEVSV